MILDSCDRSQVSALKAIRQDLLDVRRHRPVVRGDHPAAPVAVAGVVQQVEILAAGLEVVTAFRVEGEREVVVERVHVLVAIARQVVVPAGREAPEGDVRTVGRDAVGRLPVVRPRRQRELVDAVRRVTRSEVVQGVVAEDLRDLTDDVGRMLFVAVGSDGWLLVPGPNGSNRSEWFTLPISRVFDEQLVIDTDARQLHVSDARSARR